MPLVSFETDCTRARGYNDHGMQHIQYETVSNTAVIKMARGKANALNAEMLAELDAALNDTAGAANIRAVVLTSNQPGFFSAGFDIREVFQYAREPMRRFLTSFGMVVHKLHHLPKPTVAAITGHAFAGGAILALACDFRVMAEGEFGFAMNEINAGVVLPPLVFRLLTDAAGVGNARRMVLTGETVPPARAREIGLVDEITAPAGVLSRAMELAQSLAEKPPATYLAIKAVIREVTGHAETDTGAGLAPPLEPWFTPEAEQRKRAMRAAMEK